MKMILAKIFVIYVYLINGNYIKESLLIILIFFFLINHSAFTQVKSENEQREIGYYVLDLEKKADFDVGNAYMILDSIMLVAENELKSLKKEKYTKEEATNILKTIGNILDSFNLKYIEGEIRNILSTSLIEKKSDCAILVTLYLTIAQRLNFPLYCMIGRNLDIDHIFINWQDNYLNFYWETLYNTENIENFNYKQKLNNYTLKSIGYFNIGKAKRYQNDLKGAIEYYTKSIEINPEYAIAYNNRGLMLYYLKEYEKAKEDFTKAIGINPKYDYAYNNRGITLSSQREYEKALEDFIKAIEINPKAPEPYKNKGIALSRLGRIIEAAECFIKANELKNK